MNLKLLIVATCFVALLVVSCSNLSREDARKAFMSEHPDYSIVDFDTGEGWDGVVNYHFTYRKPGDEQKYAEVWTFERQEDGTWRVTGRWTPRE